MGKKNYKKDDQIKPKNKANISVIVNDKPLFVCRKHYKLRKLKNKVYVKSNKKFNNKVFYLKNKNKASLIKRVLAGIFIGFINGFWGGGGGMVCVPTLTSVLKLKQKQAQATSIFIILPLSLFSIFIYYKNGNIQISGYEWVIASFTLGGLLGALLLKEFNNLVLKAIFALIIIAGGIRLVT